MRENLLVGLAAIPSVGVGAQWLAWRMKMPSILLLLALGLLAGPGTGWLSPDDLLGKLLFPLVSLSVALILFEGGMSLHLRELRGIGGVVRNLCTVGPIVAWITGAVAAYYVGQLPLGVSLLVAAILVVTGPTVIMPLLRSVRTKGRISALMRWEGIVNDPIGAVLAVLIFEVLLQQQLNPQTGDLWHHLAAGALRTGGVGLVLGWVGGRALVFLLRRHWVPDFLHSPVALGLVLSSFAASNYLQEESGLVTVTVMGITLVNQHHANVRHILEFLENLRTLLISTLFVVLAARLTHADLAAVDGPMLLFLVTLIVVVRPATIFLSTMGSDLSIQEKLFLSWMAPRGIVAASVASVFAIRLGEAGMPGAEKIVPVIFLVIVGTVTLYGFTARWAAEHLGVLEENPQGTLILGAHRVARAIGKALQSRGYRVMLLDSNWRQVAQARLEGLPVTFGNAFSAKILHGLQLEGIGKLLAMTPNDQINALACVHFVEVFGRGGVYQLAPDKAQVEGYHEYERPLHLHGRYLFGDAYTYQQLDVMLAQRAEVKFTKLTDEFTMADFRELYGEGAIPLFLARPDGSLLVSSEGQDLRGPGSLVSLVPARALKAAEARLSSEREEEERLEDERAEAARATRSRAEEYLREEREARQSEPMVAPPGAAQEDDEVDGDAGEAAEDEAGTRASGTSPESA